jgi:hypothetical protein
MAHPCNPSYSGGIDQEDCDSKLAWANSLRGPTLKYQSLKTAGGVAQCVGPEFKLQYRQKKPKHMHRPHTLTDGCAQGRPDA